MYFQKDAPYLRDSTRIFWKEILPDYENYISEITFEELMAIRNSELKQKVKNLIKNFTVLERTEDVDKLTEMYLSLRKMPKADAMHLVFWSLGEANFIVTWNLRHLYKAGTQEVVREINMHLKLPVPIIVTPENFFNEEV
jgi:predicted nucleic acid-binding protein